MTGNNTRWSAYDTGAYWRKRESLLYYQYLRQILDFMAIPGATMVDVGSGNSPYLDWFDWASYRLSVDIQSPYQSNKVEAVTADILKYRFATRYDFCLCLQVLEHLKEPEPFARRLFEIGKITIISVPYKWPRGLVKWHAQDPVDRERLRNWTGRSADYEIIVEEPMKARCHQRLISIYDPDKQNEPFQAFKAKRKKI